MRSRFTWDRFTDFHLLVSFAVALALAGAGILALPQGWWGASIQAPPVLRPIGWAMLAGAFGLLCWALADRRAERRRRAKLDQEVDAELSGKWNSGFARAVGAYEKPWYLLCGETGVGKTAALRAANLPKATAPDGQALSDARQGINGTFMFDWWFLEDAVVLDSAGDLLQNPDQRWVSFLQRVRAGRPLQPINGMLLAIAAPDLLSTDRQALQRKARLLARQVEVARQQLRVRFPLYVLITKADLIPGFSGYFPPSDDPEFNSQILGWSNPRDPRTDDGSARTAAEVREGLRVFVDELRVQQSSLLRAAPMQGNQTKRIDQLDEMFTFPRAVAGLLGGLELLVDEVLSTGNTQFAPPFVRGVYFTSALQNAVAPHSPAVSAALARTSPLEQDSLDAPSRADDESASWERGLLWDALDFDGPARPSAHEPVAYFLRDLLLEKVIPEAGIVTPLQDVVSGIRRRGRTLATAAIAASLLVAGTATFGFVRTVGRTRPHSEFWARIVEKADANALDDLALFNSTGSYQGKRVDAVMGASVLETQEFAADLEDDQTSTWLLPLSAYADSQRKLAHARLFDELFLRPLLTPPPAGGPMPPLASLPPPALVRSIVALSDQKQPFSSDALFEAARQMLQWRASWPSTSNSPGSAVSAASPSASPTASPAIDDPQLRQLLDLLDRAARHQDDASAALSAAQQESLVKALAQWITAWTQRNSAAVSDWSDQTVAMLLDAREMVDREDQIGLPSQDPRDLKTVCAALQDLTHPAKTPLPARVSGDALIALDEAVNQRFQVPANFDDIRKSLPGDAAIRGLTTQAIESPDSTGNSSSEKALRDAAVSLDEYQALMASQCRRIGQAVGLNLPQGVPLPALRQVVAETVRQFEQTHFGTGQPLVIQRQQAYRALLALLQNFDDAKAMGERFDAIKGADYPHPIFRLAEVLRGLGDQARHVREQAPAGAYGADAHRSAIFIRAWNEILDRALAHGQLLAWNYATEDADHAWLTPAAAKTGRLDLTFTQTPSTSVARTLLASRDLNVRHLQAWFATFADLETILKNEAPEDPIAVRARLDSAGAALEAICGQYIEVWSRMAREAGRGNLKTWSDLRRIGEDTPDAIQTHLTAQLESPRQGLGFLEDQDRFPAVRAAADKAFAPLNDNALPPTASVIVRFLRRCNPDSALKTREALLRDSTALQQWLPQAMAHGEAGASVVQDFWADLTSRTVNMLIAETRPIALERLRDLYQQTNDRFPLCRDGNAYWMHDDLSSLAADLEILRPPSSAQVTGDLARRIRDLDLIDPSWDQYLNWLQQFNAFLAAREAWKLEISKANHRGLWQAVRVTQPGSAQQPASEQMYLGEDRPPEFTIEGGAALRGGMSISLLSRLTIDGGVEAATLDNKEIEKPWSILRLALTGEEEPLHIPIVENRKSKESPSIVLKLSSTNESVLHGMPEKTPALPK